MGNRSKRNFFRGDQGGDSRVQVFTIRIAEHHPFPELQQGPYALYAAGRGQAMAQGAFKGIYQGEIITRTPEGDTPVAYFFGIPAGSREVAVNAVYLPPSYPGTFQGLPDAAPDGPVHRSDHRKSR